MFKKIINAVWEYIKKAKVELIVLFAALALDLISKAIIAGTMELYEQITLIPKFLHFHYTHNYAAAFGSSFGLDKLLGEKGTLAVFIVISIAAVGLFSYVLFTNRGKSLFARISLALIIGGALGNLYDRVALGYVRDFIEFEYLGLTIFGSKSFAIFNIADAALVIGVIMFAIFYILIYKEPEPEKAEQTKENSQAPDASAQNTEADAVTDEKEQEDDKNS